MVHFKLSALAKVRIFWPSDGSGCGAILRKSGAQRGEPQVPFVVLGYFRLEMCGWQICNLISLVCKGLGD